MRIINLQIELFTENGRGYVASLFGTLLFIILDPPLAIVSSSPQCMTSWSSKCGFYKLIEYIIKEICHGEQNAKICAIGETVLKLEVCIDKELIRRERRDGREGEERGLRKGAERGER